MWTTSGSLNAKIRPRPARIAYLVPIEPSDVLLDTLFAESLSRWGGRRTPMIPTDGKAIDPEHWALLDLWDADILYSYVELSTEIENRLFYNFAPSEIRLHEGLTEHKDAHGLRPDYTGNFEFLSSLSLLPIFARRSQMRGADLPEIVDKEPWVRADKDMEDSFGFVSNGSNDFSLLPYARRLSLRPKPNSKIVPRHNEPNEISYVENIENLVENITKRRDLLTLSVLSDMFCPYLRQLASTGKDWNDRMTIVVGDEIADRLLFWNAQHRYRALNGLDDIPILRLSPKRFTNGSPEWIKYWIAIRNHRHMDGNAAPNISLLSSSLPKEQLDSIAASLGDKRRVMISCTHYAEPTLFDACKIYASETRQDPIGRFPSSWVHSTENRQSPSRFQKNEFELRLVPPWHIRDFAAPALIRGIWAADLCLDRSEDHSSFEHHFWKWPRRLRLEQAVEFENYIGPSGLVIPPLIRPTENGDLTVWDCTSWTRPRLTLPSDYLAFTSALARYVWGSVEERKARNPNSSQRRFDKVSISDKGRDLIGVFQFFGSLPEALEFLTDHFWLYVINRLSPEEAANSKKKVRDLTEKIQSLIQQNRFETNEAEFLAKRALSLAARSFVSQNEQSKWARFEKLSAWAFRVTGEKQHDIHNRLNKSLTYLRDHDFLWQGFGWRCSFCQHHNWITLERLSPIANCEICRTPKSSPVSGSLHFRLNPFVQHAFSSGSGQKSVIWCLDNLARRARSSFAFAPALNTYRAGESTPETDLDLIAAVDGQVYIAEVKSSFSGVDEKVLSQLERLANELRPDVVLLAVMEIWTDNVANVGIIQKFKDEFQIKDVEFELLTLNHVVQSTSDNMIAQPHHRKMHWSA